MSDDSSIFSNNSEDEAPRKFTEEDFWSKKSKADIHLAGGEPNIKETITPSRS